MFALDKYSVNDCGERCDRNILSCFSGNGDCFNNHIAKYEDVIASTNKIKLVTLFLQQ